VLNLQLPNTGAEAWLAARARAHFDIKVCPDVTVKRAAEIILFDRAEAGADAPYRPGTSEFLDLLRATVDIAPRNGGKQLALLESFAAPMTRNKRAVSIA